MSESEADEGTLIAVDLPAAYSQGGFVQVRTVIVKAGAVDVVTGVAAVCVSRHDAEPRSTAS